MHTISIVLRQAISFLRYRAYIGFSLGLVALGISCFSPPLWELVLRALLGAASAYGSVPPFEGNLVHPWASYAVGVSLVCIGLSMFAYFFAWDERRAQEQDKYGRYFLVSLRDTTSWISVMEDTKNSGDPKYQFSIPLLFETGASDVRVLSVSVVRYCFGCSCWMLTPTIRVHGAPHVYTFMGNFKDIQAPLRLEPHSSVNLDYVQRAAGPAPGFDAHELESGEYEIVVKYRIGTASEPSTHRLLLAQQQGTLTRISQISDVPFLSDSALQDARALSLVSPDEYALASTISERDRYLVIRLGHAFARHDSRLEFAYETLKVIQEKLWNYAAVRRDG